MGLASTTPPAWAAVAARDLPALLSDHAHCELKAAVNALTMCKRNPDRAGLPLRLSLLAREETEHCHRVLRELAERGLPLLPDAPSPYGEGLHRLARESRRGSAVPALRPVAAGEPGGAAGASRPASPGLLDQVLVSALIELRSHERLAALAACPALGALAPLYRAFCEAEARHGELFLAVACELAPAEVVERRFAELARGEAALLSSLPCGPRVHSGTAGLVVHA